MLRWIAWGVILTSTSAYAGSTLTDTRFTSCAHNKCVEVKAHKAYQGSLGTGSTYFAFPTVSVTDGAGLTQTWAAESVYFETASNRLFIRSMQNESSRKVEAYYELLQGKMFILQGASGK